MSGGGEGRGSDRSQDMSFMVLRTQLRRKSDVRS